MMMNKTTDIMSLILSNEKGAEAVMHDFTARYSLVEASAQLDLISLYAQGHRYHRIDDSEQERMNQFTEAMNDLLIAVFRFCEKLPHEPAERPAKES